MVQHAVRRPLGESVAQKKPVLFERQRRLLALLNALGRVHRLDFQKLLFLYGHERDVEAPYEFVPHAAGAFSFTCAADQEKLLARGLIVNEDDCWRLTDAGKQAARCPSSVVAKLSAFALRTRQLRGESLVAETYRRFPYYATRSEVAERVLRGDADALRRIAEIRTRMAAATAQLLTIGYEGRTLESYLNTLLRAGVTTLCDVRRNPISRKYGFSKRVLASAADQVGIRYEHLPELGIASADRKSLVTQADYDALFADYERSHLPRQTEALNEIRTWLNAGDRVALTCYERQPEQCHRRSVAQALTAVRATGSVGLATKHL